jgi:hypothetical protein
MEREADNLEFKLEPSVADVIIFRFHRLLQDLEANGVGGRSP